MPIFWTFLAVLLSIAFLVWYSHQRKRNYWKRQNVELLNIWTVVKKSRDKCWGLVMREFYLEMREKSQAVAALEVPLISMLIVQDPHTLKDLLVTNFQNFTDRGFFVNTRSPLDANLSRLDYEQWKPLRQNISPGFSPAKIKFLFPTVLQMSERLVEVVKELCTEAAPSPHNIYDLCARYNTDVMGQVIFGIECNSLRDPRTEFRVFGDKAFDLLKNPLKDIIGIKFPKLFQLFDIRVFDKESNEFFKRIVRDCLDQREKSGIQRRDFMDILINMRKENESRGDYSLTLETLVGQVGALFVGGFETTSCTMAYALYELSKHPDIQERAREEIQEVMANNNGHFTHESLKDMKYLYQIMMETLRKYPVIPYMSRVCRHPARLKTSTGSVAIQPGTLVVIPYYGIHYNPDYYPEPEEFRPERFTEEINAHRDSCTFMPFGDGPRACIGEPLGKLQIILGLAGLLSQFKFSLCEKSPKQLTFDPKNLIVLFVKGGVHLNVEKL